MRIAAVIPAFNEEHNIAAVVEGARPFVAATVVVRRVRRVPLSFATSPMRAKVLHSRQD